MSDSTKKTETFILNIYDRQNATWQGSVTWVDKKEKQQVLESLKNEVRTTIIYEAPHRLMRRSPPSGNAQ